MISRKQKDLEIANIDLSRDYLQPLINGDLTKSLGMDGLFILHGRKDPSNT